MPLRIKKHWFVGGEISHENKSGIWLVNQVPLFLLNRWKNNVRKIWLYEKKFVTLPDFI